MKAVLMGISQWFHAYRTFSLGKIKPTNILFDDYGHIKLAHIFSFPPEDFIVINGKVF